MPPLIANLEKHGQPHDFVPVQNERLDWESNALLNPEHIMDAIDRHRDKTIIWLDVDCTVHGDLSPLVELPGDIGLRYYIKHRKGRSLILSVQSGTMVIKPTKDAYRLIHAWYERCWSATVGEYDEATLTQAIVNTLGGVAITLRWVSCGYRRAADPIIVHARACLDTPKVSKLIRFLHRHK